MQNTRNKILDWVNQGLIEKQHIDSALRAAHAQPSAVEWLAFLKSSLLWFAIIAAATGTIFFFAYNWQDMGRFVKFSLIETAILTLFIAHIRFANDKRISHITLMGLSLFTGGLLALVGQTYQTGADPWQLFATWSLFILPWVVIARASSLWIGWVLLINLATALYLDVNHQLFGFLINEDRELWVFTLLNALLLICFELAPFVRSRSLTKNKTTQVMNRYATQCVAFFAGTAATMLAIWSIFDWRYDFVGLGSYLLFLASATYIYRYKVPDLFLLSMLSISFIVVTVSLFAEFFIDSLNSVGFLVISFTIISLSTLAAMGLKNVAKEFNRKELSHE